MSNEFWRRIDAYPRLKAELIMASLLINILGLASSLYSIQVMNRYLALGIGATLLTLTVGACIAVVFELILRAARLNVAQWLCNRADEDLSNVVFESSVRGQYMLLDQLPSAARREIISGLATVQQSFGATNVIAFLDAPFALVFLLVLALINPLLALVTLMVMVAVAVYSLLLQRQLREPMEEQSRISIQLAGYQQTLAASTEMVRAFLAAKPIGQYWRKNTGELAKVRSWLNRLQSGVQNAGYAGGVILAMLVMAVGAREVLTGNLDAGTLIGANILASRALAALTRALSLGEPIGRGARALELIRQLSVVPKERSDGVSLARYTGSLRFDDCAFAYPKQATPIFERFDFELPAGGVVAVIGANGTGKTTLARLIVALLEPNRGRVLADGMDLRQADPTWWRQQLAYLPQEPVFFDATLRENLTVLDPVATDEDILSLCRELGVAGFVEGGPDGLSLLVRNGGSSIPVGIRRRLALVRALIGRGHLVVLDDPTEGVDAEGCKSIAAVLNRLARSGRSLVVMTNESFIISAAQAVIDLNQKPSPRVLKATPTESKVTDQPL